MPASTTRRTYYNGFMWHMVLLPDGTRAVWPARLDGQPAGGAATRYYRRASRPGDRHPAHAASSG